MFCLTRERIKKFLTELNSRTVEMAHNVDISVSTL